MLVKTDFVTKGFVAVITGELPLSDDPGMTAAVHIAGLKNIDGMTILAAHMDRLWVSIRCIRSRRP